MREVRTEIMVSAPNASQDDFRFLLAQKEVGFGAKPQDLRRSRAARRGAPYYAPKALKGFGGKQEFSPGLFLPTAEKDIFLITLSTSYYI